MMNKKEYSRLVKEASPNSPVVLNCLKAFLVGGAICTVGQGLTDLYMYLGLVEKNSKSLTSITLIFLGVLLTVLGVYDNIAKHAGAGTLVPITGFANSIASPAIEFKSEGFILGVGAKIFSIAGPVIAYGTVASVVYGIIYYFCQFVF
ncbi:MAG: stage V sporulation protein AC [Clostridia bacterium]|nr:stage V sporulation protein AC [Clostridia bacterium]